MQTDFNIEKADSEQVNVTNLFKTGTAKPRIGSSTFGAITVAAFTTKPPEPLLLSDPTEKGRPNVAGANRSPLNLKEGIGAAAVEAIANPEKCKEAIDGLELLKPEDYHQPQK